MPCWPPCSPWCDCINDRCQVRAAKINAVRLRTPDGRYLTRAASEFLTASLAAPSQSATFRLVSRPTSAPLTIPPPATVPMPSGSQISLAECDSDWAPSINLVRVERSTMTTQSPGKSFYLVTYFFGGPGTFVRARAPFSSGFPAYISESDSNEWLFSIEKSDGSSIRSGDQVSLRIDSSRTDVGPFYFRTTSALDQALIAADGTAAFLSDTLFIIEFHEVDATRGLRPGSRSIRCQICGPVRGTVSDGFDGAPLAGATVEALGVLENHAFSATTNANGGFTLTDSEGRTCVPPGDITLRATADRHVPKMINPIPNPTALGGANVSIILDCTKVRGRVIDGNVPPNPQIFAPVFIDFPDGTTASETTNQIDGTFIFDCVRHGQAEIRTPPLSSQPINVLPEGILVELIVPQPCVEIVGTVTDSVTGFPICDALVTYFGSSNSAKTNEQGRYTIACASPGGLRSLFSSKPGYQPTLVVVAPFPASGSVTKDIALQPTSNTGLFNTGVDACGGPLADGTVGDAHYKLISVPGGTTDIRVRTSAGGHPVPPYLADNSESAWIGPNGDDDLNGPAGEYVYRTTFNLTGVTFSGVSIVGQWCTDNDGVRIVLNGADTGNPGTAFDQFQLAFAPFVISSGFVAGLNTLDFVVNNGDGPTALRVEMTLKVTP